MLAEAVARGEATTDQIAAAEAAEARREVAELRQQREQDRIDAARRDQAARVAAERAAVEDFKTDLRGVVEASAEFPIVAATVDRGALDHAYSVGEELYSRTGRVPSAEEVLRETEARLRGELQEITGRVSGRAPAPRGSPTAQRAIDDGNPAARRRAFMDRLGEILRRID